MPLEKEKEDEKENQEEEITYPTCSRKP